MWAQYPDYSHGPLVPIFSAVLLWIRRTVLTSNTQANALTFVLGAISVSAGGLLASAGVYIRMNSVEAMSIIPYLFGIAVCCGGWKAVRWTWPSILFLVFMIPLPGTLGNQMSGVLQHCATVGSTYVLQCFGVSAVSEGNTILLSNATLGVAEACSGIRMLVSFFALTSAMCLVVPMHAVDKAVLVLSAPMIAIVTNVIRIAATGAAYECGNTALGNMIFHDLAGWLMMPVAFCLLWGEMILLSKVFPSDGASPERLR
jgi:exosortase